MTIFKAYDIRGKYPIEIDEEICKKIGFAFFKLLKPKNCVIGMDMRNSSIPIKKALIGALNDSGADVYDIGLCSTPAFYFAVNQLNADCGIMITASHNPKEYNGLKLVENEARPINYDNGIRLIEERIDSNSIEKSSQAKKGESIEKNIENEYLNYLKKYCKRVKKMKIVVDYANGMAALSSKKMLESLNLELINLYDELDGSFPNHEANPLKPENTFELQKKVLKEKADFGISFDGDADRMLIVDDLGERIEGDITTAIIARQILKEKKGEKIMHDLRSTKAVAEIIKENGGIPLMSRVGHSFIKAQMRKENAIFAGEISGHYYFRDNFFTDSADIALLLIISLLSNEDKKLSEIKKEIIRYYQSGEMNKKVENKEEVFERLKEKYSNLRQYSLDGLTFEAKDYWFNVRASNTEPLIRLNLEANSKELMGKKTGEVFGLIY